MPSVKKTVRDLRMLPKVVIYDPQPATLPAYRRRERLERYRALRRSAVCARSQSDHR